MTLVHAIYVIDHMRETDEEAFRSKFPTMTREQFAVDRFQASDFRYCCIARDGEPVAVGGMQFATKGVGTLWMIATDRLHEHAIECTRFGRRIVRTALAEGLAHRLQSYTLTRLPFCRRFVEVLGFRREATCRSMGANGEDIDIFAMVRA